MSIERAVELAAPICARFEGFRPAPYLCPANVWTIGYGSTRDRDGKPVAPSTPPVTKEEAHALMLADLRRFAAQVVGMSPVLAAHPGAWAAITDFAYNLGAGRYRASTLRRKVEAEAWAEAEEQLLLWVRGGGKVLPGLVKRRKADAALLPR